MARKLSSYLANFPKLLKNKIKKELAPYRENFSYMRLILFIGGAVQFSYGLMFQKDLGAEDNLQLRGFVWLIFLLLIGVSYINDKYDKFVNRYGLIITGSLVFLEYLYFLYLTAPISNSAFIFYHVGLTNSILILILFSRYSLDLIFISFWTIFSCFFIAIFVDIDSSHKLNLNMGISAFLSSYFIGLISYGWKNSLIKQWKRQKEENYKNEKYKNLFNMISKLSHKINNPLFSLSSSLDIIDLISEDEKIKKQTGIQRNEVRKIEKILRVLNTCYENNYQIERINLHNFLLGYSSNFPISITGEPDIDFLFNPKDLNYIFNEIFSNSMREMNKHNIQDKKIYINILKNKKILSIQIYDLADSLPRDNDNKIFDLFYSTENINSKHLGLGLSYAKAFIEKHEGRIYCNKGRIILQIKLNN